MLQPITCISVLEIRNARTRTEWRWVAAVLPSVSSSKSARAEGNYNHRIRVGIFFTFPANYAYDPECLCNGKGAALRRITARLGKSVV